MAHPIFNTPEILRLIFEHVGSHNLEKLVTVSRRFFFCAIPFTWRYVSRSGKLRHIVFPGINMKNVDDNWVKSIQPLGQESIDRFNIYAPHVKFLHDYVRDRHGSLSWTVLLQSVPTRPLLPNLQSLEIMDMFQFAWAAPIIDALLCPSLVEITASGCNPGSLRSALSARMMGRIADCAPKIQTLELYSKSLRRPPRYIPEARPPANDTLIALVGGLRSLSTLEAGPEILSPNIFPLLGALPCLESLGISIPDGTPEQTIPEDLPQRPNSFSALKHIAIYHPFPGLIRRLWKSFPFAQRLISVFIKVTDSLEEEDEDHGDLRSLVSSICALSPNIVDLHLDLRGEDLLPDLELFTQGVVGALKRISLQRLRIQTSNTQMVAPGNFEQLALALSKVTYLDVQELVVNFRDLTFIAKHMLELQFLAVALYPGGWPLEHELPDWLPASRSVLYLRSHYITSLWYEPEYDREAYIQSLSIALHRLWPNGVYCQLCEFAQELSEQPYEDLEAVESINNAIRQLCSPHEFTIPDTTASWRYIKDDYHDSLSPIYTVHTS